MTARFPDALDIIELVTILEFFVGWLHADRDYARDRLPLCGTYTVDDLTADTERLAQTVRTRQIGP
jgi:hypothetical protein